MDNKPNHPKRGRPPTGQMPIRYFRIGDDDWQQIESAASASGETNSQYIRRVLLKDAAKTLGKRRTDRDVK